MSVWTHTTGTIRVDAIPNLGMDVNLKELFISSTFENPNDSCNMPEGSEDSLQYGIYQNPDRSCISQYCIYFFGDLRDFGDEKIESVKDWWKDVLQKCGMVRQAVLQIKCETLDVDTILTEKDVN